MFVVKHICSKIYMFTCVCLCVHSPSGCVCVCVSGTVQSAVCITGKSEVQVASALTQIKKEKKEGQTLPPRH